MNQQTQTAHDQAVETIDQELLTQLREVSVLSSLKDDELHCLEGSHLIDIEKGDVVIRQGELSHFYWILLKGELRIFQIQPDKSEITYATIPPGTAFGELPLLTNVPNTSTIASTTSSHLLQLNEDQFWSLMTNCTEVRKAILANMAYRFQRMQSGTVQQEKMATLGTLAAGLMHELNNPGAAARRAASQLRENLIRMHQISLRFKQYDLNREQKQCMFNLQKQALAMQQPLMMNSIEQSDAEESLAEWMESVNIENAWKMAPTFVSIGMNTAELEQVRNDFNGPMLAEALGWLEALASSMQLVNTIEESIGRVTDLVYAVKSYAYEGKGQKQTLDVNNSIHATLVILGHKMREKSIVLEKDFAQGLPSLHSECTGLNQIWTNLFDNAIDAVQPGGHISIRTWAEQSQDGKSHTDLCISIADDGSGIPLQSQPQIFDPFYTTKPSGVGTGLGLGIVQRIVDQYGGTIRFASEPGHTEFVVRIPADRN